MSYVLTTLKPSGYNLVVYRSKEMSEYLSFYIHDVSRGRNMHMVDDVKMSTTMWSGWMNIPEITGSSDKDVIARFMCASEPKFERHYGRTKNGDIELQVLSLAMTYFAPYYCESRELDLLLSNQHIFEEFDKSKYTPSSTEYN
jgi:hypothetical protein